MQGLITVPTVERKWTNAMTDLISRQAVKDWLKKWRGYLDDDMIARMQIGTKDIPEGMTIINAYKIVLEDMKKCDLLCGKYDAKNGNEHFMYGVSLVMEWIATRAEDEKFCKEFSENLIGSELRK